MHGEGNYSVQLSAAAQICIRPGPAIQFGIDASRAGVFDALTPGAVQGVALAILTARHAVPRQTVAAGLIAAGLSDAGAQSLIEDLLNYRVLRALPAKPVVAMLGDDRLAGHISDMLRRSGITVREPVPGECDAAFLARVCVKRDIPVVAVNRPASEAAELGEHAATWFPVALLDGRGQLGPLRIDGAGPCPMCLELRRTEIDPMWCTVDPWECPPIPDPPVMAATTARVVACVLSFLGCGSEPPGTRRIRLLPGEMQEIDVYADEIRRWYIEPHPTCPACWAREG